MSDQFLSELNLWCLRREEAIRAMGNADTPYSSSSPLSSIKVRSLAELSRYRRISRLTWDPSRERSGGGSRRMITIFPIRASSTITFTSKRVTSARSSSRKNGWTAKQPIVSCVKQWQQSVHRASGKASFIMLSEILARVGESIKNQASVPENFLGNSTAVLKSRR